MIAILSPAKRLDLSDQNKTRVSSQPRFLNEAEELIGELRQFSPTDIAQLMDVNNNIAELNHQRFAEWQTPFTPKNSKQALLTFKGDVFQGMGTDSLEEKELKFSQDHVRILSGLYGVLRPLDLIQPYRLEMGTKLENKRGEDLYEFWGDKITNALNEDLSEQKDRTLINLASKEYVRAIDMKGIDGKVITPEFKEWKNGKYKVIGIKAKRARGMMTRFMIDNRIEDPEDLKGFDKDGYVFSQELSSEYNWVFVLQ